VFAFLQAIGANLRASARRKTRPLEVGLPAFRSGRIELRCARPVGISAGLERTLVADGA